MSNDIPDSRVGILRHFNTIVNKETPILSVFCISDELSSYGTIKKQYRRVTFAIHPDRCQDETEKRSSVKGMQLLSRALYIVQFELEEERKEGYDGSENDF